MKSKAFVSMVVYVRNAEATIQNFICAMDGILSRNYEHYEIILVNDASADKTGEKIEALQGAVHGHVSVVQLAWYHQVELAMLAGLDLAIGDFVFEIETTFKDYPEEILLDMFKKTCQGFDIVSACPISRNSPGSRFFYWIFNKLSSMPLDLKTERIRIISRRALNRVLSSKEKIRYRKAFFKLSGFSFFDLPYQSNAAVGAGAFERRLGAKIDSALELILVYTNVGANLCFFIALLFVFLFLGIGAYAVVIFVTLQAVVQGWTTIMLVLTAGFGGIFLVLGVLSKHVRFILTEVKERPLYIVRSVHQLTSNTPKVFAPLPGPDAASGNPCNRE